MAVTLNLTDKEFADIVLAFLMDKSINTDEVLPDHERLNDLMKDIGPKIKSRLLRYYLKSEPTNRLYYKRIRGTFDGTAKGIQQIRIGPSEKIKEVEKEKAGIVSKIIKKLLKKEEITQKEEELLKEGLQLMEDML